MGGWLARAACFETDASKPEQEQESTRLPSKARRLAMALRAGTDLVFPLQTRTPRWEEDGGQNTRLQNYLSPPCPPIIECIVQPERTKPNSVTSRGVKQGY